LTTDRDDAIWEFRRWDGAMNFSDLFQSATGNPPNKPYPYQDRLAQAQRLPKLLIAPTGAGKTEAAILGAWLWRRLHHPDEAVRRATPRRLVYCLPMRTLVEQTRARVQSWLANLNLSERIHITVLMGGEEADEWHLYPEQMRIIIGTQDMLLSRALNRGYSASPFKWAWEFGLLNNDCLWVLDEVQLMANGLPTSTQLQAFREGMGAYGACHTLWMSATVVPEWLRTVDASPPVEDEVFALGADDRAFDGLARRLNASKTLRKLAVPAKGSGYDAKKLADAVARLHQPGAITLIVVNTVRRAQALHTELRKLKPQADLVLVHSRFRPNDRKDKNESATAPPDADGPGRIVVATQAIEAGVDMSARTLVTELAPWSSLVQRFGRCNRRGEYSEASVYWVDLQGKDALPYEAEELALSRGRLEELEGRPVSSAALPQFKDAMAHGLVLRRRDLLGLFDTAADLSGSYLDVSRFVRGSDETDVYVFWRTWDGDAPPPTMPAPTRDELCSVPIGEIKDFLGARRTSRSASGADVADPEQEPEEGVDDIGADIQPATAVGAKRRQAWRWDHLSGRWEQVRRETVHPGQTFLLHTSNGGYTAGQGWDTASTDSVTLATPSGEVPAQEAMDSDLSTTEQKKWITLRDHALDVQKEARSILDEVIDLALPPGVRDALLTAAQHHDLGKAHLVFQETMLSNLAPEEQAGRRQTLWAKQGPGSQQGRRGHSRPYFRHEVASALGLLARETSLDGQMSDLAAYLVAAHHGKVRLAMRSLPRARDQDPSRYYLLGFAIPEAGDPEAEVKRDNTLPATDLGNGVVTPTLPFDVSIARIGVSEKDQRSWLERTLALLDDLGPFRLAYLEALLRAADVRASKAEQNGGGGHD
jgi:CRISPR-associated endonuclease/helicase Cas3